MAARVGAGLRPAGPARIDRRSLYCAMHQIEVGGLYAVKTSSQDQQQERNTMRNFSSVIAVILALAATAPAFAENASTGSSRVASLRCVQFAMVREHHQNPHRLADGLRRAVARAEEGG